MGKRLSHTDRSGRARMVDVSPKRDTKREAVALGLTISHDVGYELSPRGRTFLAAATKSRVRS